MKQKITMLGDGAWGTAVASVLAHNGHAVNIWCYDPQVAQDIMTCRLNTRYLPDRTLPDHITAVTNLNKACTAQWIFVAVPVKFLRSVLQEVKLYAHPQQKWIMLSKGIEAETCLLPSQILDDVLGYEAAKAALSGPSFAHDLAEKKITAVSLAATSATLAQEVVSFMSTSYCKIDVCDDLIGVQAGAALKNVVALAIGMLDAQGYTDNTKAFVITHALQEMASITQTLGGQPQTLYGLSGVGDLLLTCMGSLSKNVAIGKQLGSGQTLDTLLQKHPVMPEGINTVISVQQVLRKHNLHFPLFQGVYACIFQKKTVPELLSDILL